MVASASPTAGHSITGWWIYLDGAGVYNGGAVDSINHNVTVGSGTHTLVTRAWDTSGAYGDKTDTITVSSKPAVAVSAPATGSNVSSPLKVTATATASGGHYITGWHIYVDGVDKYTGGSATSINASIANVSAGSHTVLVRAWDSSGVYGDQTLSLDVATVAVTVSKPLNNASVSSPANINATASTSHTLTGWIVYVDGVSKFSQDNGTSISTNLTMSAGTHSVVVRAWDSTGAYGDQTINLTVP